jgi:hypothetical protein
MTPAAFVAGLDDTASDVVSAVKRRVSTVGPAAVPPTQHAGCCQTLS